VAAGAVIAVEPSNDGTTDSVGVGGKGVGVDAIGVVEEDGAAAGALGVADVHGDDTDGVVDAAVEVAEGVNGGTDIPGGGAATASGSSISSNGKSGNCSSKGEGEAGSPAKPLGTAGLADVPVADNADADVGTAAGSGDVADAPEVAPLHAPSSGINTKSFDGSLAVGAGVAVAFVPTPTGPMVFFAVTPLIGTPTGFDVPTGIGPVRLTPAPA
jgi:hypothetical protein